MLLGLLGLSDKGWAGTDSTRSAESLFHVVVDPGHGGRDHGASSHNVHESKIVLDVSKKIYERLRRDPRFRATLTRDKNIFLSLEERAKIANKNMGDLFISIHVNTSSDPRARGREIYFQNQLPPDEESMFLAHRENQGLSVQNENSHNSDVANILEDLERNHRIKISGKFSEFLDASWPRSASRRRQPIRQAPFYVISNVNMPSALIEMGYISNAQERKQLLSSPFQEELAQGIYEGIVKFKEFIDKTPSTVLN